MSEKKTPPDPVSDQPVSGVEGSAARAREKKTPDKVSAANGVSGQAGDEAEGNAEPLSALEAYRLDRKKMFEARLKEMRDREAFKEANREASRLAAMPRPEEQLPEVQDDPAGEPESIFVQPKSMALVAEAEPRLKKTLLSAGFFVGLPVLIALLYFGLIASNQYASTAQFSIHTNAPPSSVTESGGGLQSILAGGNASSSMGMLPVLGEMFVLQDYIESPQIIQDMKPYADLRAIYRSPQADWFARLSSGPVTDADLLKYWQSMVQVQVDNTTGLGTLTVKAFTPEEAKLIADDVLLLSEKLVNKISDRAQNDSLTLCQKEVDGTYGRVLKAHKAMTDFAVQQRISSDGGSPGLDLLSERDRLALELNFAEQAYSNALSTLEAARLVAMNKGLYLEPFVRPQLADTSLYEYRLENILLTLLVSGMLWIIGSMIFAATKDHL